MLGSQGGLGVITAVNFKVMPRPVEPHGMFGIFRDEAWLSQLKELRKLRIPLNWIQALSTSDSSWVLGMGYSGNKLNRNRIEGEIREVFGETLNIQPDGKLYSGQIFTPGEQRFKGFYRRFVMHGKWKNHIFMFLQLCRLKKSLPSLLKLSEKQILKLQFILQEVIFILCTKAQNGKSSFSI